MDVRGFLESVVPWDLGGYVSIHWHLPKQKFLGRSVQSVDAALALVTALKTKTKHNIYFCISHQKLGDGLRNKENAQGLVCIPMDADIKPGSPKHYQSLAEAVVAILQFCDTAGIPRPSLMVATGGGLHVYWLSDTVLPVAQWQPYADAVKAAALKAGVKFDAGCTGDAARVLRVPGTLNYKYDPPPQVRVLPKYGTGERLNYAEAFKAILGKPPLTGNLHVADAFKQLPVTPLAETVLKEIPPLPFAPIKAECGWLREAHETGGKDYDQPQWNLTTLIATFLENGHDLAHELGNKHPTYDYEDTEDLWARKNQERKSKNIGWPRCKTIEDSGSVHCAGCRHRAKDKSPVNIGFEAYTNPVDEDLKELGGSRPADLRLPAGFCLNDKGQVCAIIKAKKVKGGIQPARLVVCLRTLIRHPSLQYQEGQFGVGFIADTDKSGTIEVFLSSSNCFGRKLLERLAEKCVLYNNDREAEKMVQQFAPAWLDKLLKADTAIRDSGTMGWRFEAGKRIGFVYGNTLYHENGTNVALLASTDSDFRSWYVPAGTREVWLEACKLLTDRKRPELDCIIAVGFAAPLMTFAGTLYGAILSFWGEPGTAKSTAQQVAAAVFGHPKQTRESLNSTPKSVQGRLGRCRNLAAYWDDIQDERHQEALFNTMFVATQGAEGGRLNTDSTYKERLEWQTLLAACSNSSFVEYLVRKQKSTTAGMRRVFEIEFNKRDDDIGMVNAVDAGRVFAALEQNYGVIGAEYARMLASEHVAIDLMVADTCKAFREKVEGTSDENYWWGSCGVLLVGAQLANRLGANLDIEAMEEHLRISFINNRNIRSGEGTEGGSYANTEHALVSFLNFYIGSGNSVVVDRLFEHKHKPVSVLRQPGDNRPVYVEIARDQRKVVFSKREMREFLAKKEIQARQVFNGLAGYFKAVDVKITLGGGTRWTQGQEYCIEITVPFGQPHVLNDLLTSHGSSKQDFTVISPEA